MPTAIGYLASSACQAETVSPCQHRHGPFLLTKLCDLTHLFITFNFILYVKMLFFFLVWSGKQCMLLIEDIAVDFSSDVWLSLKHCTAGH